MPALRFLSGLCDREHRAGAALFGGFFLSGLCDREQAFHGFHFAKVFLSGLCDREPVHFAAI